MNINDIMLRDMAEAKKRAEIEEAEREARAIRKAEKIVDVGCAVLSALAFATLAVIVLCCFCKWAHKRRTAQLPNRELPITNCTVTIGNPLLEGTTGDLDCGDKKLTFTNGVLHAVSD